MAENGKLSRRDFLKIAGVSSLGVAVSAATGFTLGKREVERREKDLHKQLEEQLYATATAVVKKNERNSFVPEGKFTQNLYNKVKQGTFAIDIVSNSIAIDIVSNSTKLRTYKSLGTSWCAHKDGNNVYIVSNRHAFDLPDKLIIKSINIWRPGIDNQKITPTNLKVAKSDNYDIVILKCTLTPEQAQVTTPLVFKDNAEIKKGDQFLIVGFPYEFRGTIDNETDILTSGLLMTVDNYDARSKVWSGKAPTDGGNSGSPAVIPNDTGEPVVVGIVYGGGYQDTVGLSLNVNELITAVDSS